MRGTLTPTPASPPPPVPPTLGPPFTMRATESGHIKLQRLRLINKLDANHAPINANNKLVCGMEELSVQLPHRAC